ncbi:MAG: 16S rRNA (uracil(1498)-N(3))-methyltransferase [Firmicutes bacterium]|nr:16S rRNA (uracil(1498)-N(3))-methyltransferase [Bacillota bacterium]
MSHWFMLSPEKLYRKGNNEESIIPRENVILQPENVAHIRALRLSQGDGIVITDGQGRAFKACLGSVDRRGAKVRILCELKRQVEPPLDVILFVGISKGEKTERIVRQSVELGVRKIVPVLTGRTVVRIATEEKGKRRTRRWQNIAISAALQCRRSVVPEVLLPLSFEEALGLMRESELVIVPWEEEKKRGFGTLAENIKNPSSVSIFTGPEGGISLREMEKLREIPGLFEITLGPRILRAETAPLAVLSVVMFLWGDLSGKG